MKPNNTYIGLILKNRLFYSIILINTGSVVRVRRIFDYTIITKSMINKGWLYIFLNKWSSVNRTYFWTIKYDHDLLTSILAIYAKSWSDVRHNKLRYVIANMNLGVWKTFGVFYEHTCCSARHSVAPKLLCAFST